MADSDRHPRVISTNPRLSREEIANQPFPQAFRGLSEPAVRAFLRKLADEFEALRTRHDELGADVARLEKELEEAPAGKATTGGDDDLMAAVGEETARVLRSAKESADEIRRNAEERAAELVEHAQEEARALRESAEQAATERTREADASSAEILREAERLARELREGAEARVAELVAQSEAEARTDLESARRRSAELVAEGQATRDRTLNELHRRRETLETQIEVLRTGRDRLLEAYRVVKQTFEHATESLLEADSRPPSPPEGEPGGLASPALPVQTPVTPKPAPPPTKDAEAAEAETTEAEATEAETSAAEPAEAEPGEPEPEPEPERVEPAAARVSSFSLGELPGAVPGAAAPVADEPPVEPTDEAVEESGQESGEREPSGEAGGDESVAEPSSEAGPEREATGRPAPKDADAIFAKLKAEHPDLPEEPGESDETEEGSEEEVSAAPEASDASDPDSALLRRRDDALEALVDEAVRQVKRVVRDEQNVVLEAVREHKKGTPEADDVLPSVVDQDRAFADAAGDSVAAACAAGEDEARRLGVAGPVNGSGAKRQERTAELVAVMARQLMDPLRAKLADALREAATVDDVDVAEKIRARYREWKGQRIETNVRDVLTAAFARGLFDAVPDGVALRWVPGDAAPCPDCADNALEHTSRGREFPTGHLLPPAHAGCRCLALPEEVPADSGVPVAKG